jgi:hypothetical protein
MKVRALHPELYSAPEKAWLHGLTLRSFAVVHRSVLEVVALLSVRGEHVLYRHFRRRVVCESRRGQNQGETNRYHLLQASV